MSRRKEWYVNRLCSFRTVVICIAFYTVFFGLSLVSRSGDVMRTGVLVLTERDKFKSVAGSSGGLSRQTAEFDPTI